METTRRDFIKASLLLGSSLIVNPAALYASAKTGEPWEPAYKKLDREGKFAQRIKEAYAMFEN